MKEIELKCYTKLDYIVMESNGLHATLHLLELLWNDKTMIQLNKVKYDTQNNIVTIITNDYRYEFTNVPLQWDGRIDIHTIYSQHIQTLKESEVKQ